ncbi:MULTISPECIES: SDR family NAD(P)-dependent oxidoreductase [unclassified Rhizobium]|uniref:SDR family NAD(P)-dependent oxidoreductase n=1 Tax=unclassified Rhizobium TaxID=2613769 RepID=UPI000EAA3E8E|nr:MULTISPECIES: SDR family NAD(P)-dependent oxidoreductase [unclassified Rhizobium]AYG70939.1 SDR family NAD(P)-dependent oxidoreductase [Rhizobium sp. CCGE531]AYG77250.1 SDR family NAD(P)-dependent oxidoreductase [Rhizobium sp. CCGE532]
MSERMNSIVAPGRVAVITGAAKGIGLAIARALAARGMKLALLDLDTDALENVTSTLDTDTLVVSGDVSDLSALTRLQDETVSRFGDVAILLNNAGITQGAGPWDDPAKWRRQIDVNFGGVLAAQHVFVPYMIKAARPSAVVNLGSKEGITTPPGNAAYSVAKAAVKVLTEQLSHELLKESEGRVSAHLLVPGYTWTPMNIALKPQGTVKPDEAWTAEQLVEYFLARLLDEDFYIICPDNAVTSVIDARRIRWAADDMILNRPALSRWHPDWMDKFAAWLKAGH